MNAPAYSGNASAYCVRIIGSDVYVVGFIGRDEQPALWKNGTWVDVALPEGAKDATLWSVYGDGSHVWIGGIVEFARTDDSPYLWCPYLWKDGEPIRLDQTDNSSPEVYDIGGLGGVRYMRSAWIAIWIHPTPSTARAIGSAQKISV